jgi:hypothetical protein
MIKESLCRGSENNVVYIEKQVGGMSVSMKDKERRIGMRWRKAYSLNKSGETLKPGTGSLFKTIQGLL